MSETSEITTPLIKAVNSVPGCDAIRIQCGKVQVKGGWMYLAPEGTPDVFILVKGQPAYCETKLRGEKPSAVQLQRHEELRRAGARVEIVRSVPEGMTVVRQMLETRR